MDWTIIDEFPRGPGVYIFSDSQGTPIYIGMAANLRNRVRSYRRQEISNHSEEKKVQLIQACAAHVEYIVAENKLGAKIMEDYLIFHLRPSLNGVMLPINYNYLKISCKEEFPRLLHTKDIRNDGGVYFGPFHSYSRSKDVLFDLRRIFKLRTCEGLQPGQKGSKNNASCLNYEAGHCLGPCRQNIAEIDTLRKEYLSNVDALARVLEGDLAPLNDKFSEKMRKAADDLDFETAALYKNKQERISHALSRKKMKLIGPADLQKILQRVENYMSRNTCTHSRPEYSHGE